MCLNLMSKKDNYKFEPQHRTKKFEKTSVGLTNEMISVIHRVGLFGKGFTPSAMPVLSGNIIIDQIHNWEVSLFDFFCGDTSWLIMATN